MSMLSSLARRGVQDRTETTPEDVLLDLAAQLEPDGGMPGKDRNERMARSVAVLYAMISHGHTRGSGAFRSHVARLLDFLKGMQNQDPREKEIVERAIEAELTGHAPPGDWLKIAQRKAISWEQVAGKC